MSQQKLDKWCCQECNKVQECDAFQVSDVWGKGKKHTCELKSYSWTDKRKHGNVKGAHLPKTDDNNKTYDIDGAVIGVHKGLKFASQVEIDEVCATMCEQTPGCEIWVTDVISEDFMATAKVRTSTCTLKRSSKLSGLANKGLAGVSGKSNGNWLGEAAIKTVIDWVLNVSHMCEQDDTFNKLAALAGSDVAVAGEGSLSMDVPEAFFGMVDLATPDATNNMQAFKVTQKHLVGSLTAATADLQSVVDTVLKTLDDALMGPMAEQMGSPVAFWLGAVLSQCLDDPAKCVEKAPDDELEMMV